MRQGMLLMFVIPGLFSAWAASPQDEIDPGAVVNKAIRAHGGEAKLAAIRAEKIQSKGTGFLPLTIYADAKGKVARTTFDDKVDFTREASHLFPHRFKEELAFNCPIPNEGIQIPTKLTSVFNRDKASARMNHKEGLHEKHIMIPAGAGQTRINVNVTQLKEKMHRQQVQWLVCLKDKAYTLTALKEENVAGKPVVGVRAKRKGFQDIDLFFDKQTGLLVMMRYLGRADEAGKQAVEEEIVTAYQQVEGVQVPKNIVVNRNGEEIWAEEFIKIQLLKDLDEKEFTRPKSGLKNHQYR